MTEPYFFSTGMARSGTNLLSKVLTANRALHSVIGSNIELYRQARDASVFSFGDEVDSLIPRNSAFSDFFGNAKYFDILEHMFKSNFEINFEKIFHDEYKVRSSERFPHDSPDLISIYDKSIGKTFKDSLDLFTANVRIKRNISTIVKVGFHESWHIEMFPALIASYPNAKFLIMIRDVRGSYSSHKVDTEKNLSHRVSLLNYARQFRKYAGLAKLFSGKYKNVHLVKYEDLMKTPEKVARELCEFLEVGFDFNMLSPEHHIEQSTGQPWAGNSGDALPVFGFDESRSESWQHRLSEIEVRSIENLCRFSLESFDYKLNYNSDDSLIDYFSFLRTSKNSGRWGDLVTNLELDLKKEELYVKTFKNKTKVDLKHSLKLFFSPEYFLAD